MRRVVVLSPHRDDATFSLALSMKRWSAAGTEITVLNFFTRSGYAPYAREGADISEIRRREDVRSLKAVHSGLRMRSLGLSDAPLRLPIDFGSLTNPEVFTPLAEEVTDLCRTIQVRSRNSLVIAPLGLGDHIDHRTIHEAATAALPSMSLAFYEDLPYTSWVSENAIRERVSSVEARGRTFLLPTRQHFLGWRFKRRVVSKYQSQIDERMVELIARHGERYKGGERVWIPRHSARWRTIVDA